MTIRPRNTGSIQANLIDEKTSGAGLTVQPGINFLKSVSGTNTITASLTTAISAYDTGFECILVPAAANTDDVTINLHSLGAKSIVDIKGEELLPGALLTTGMYKLVYNGTKFVCLNPDPGNQSYTPTFFPSGTYTLSSTTSNTARYSRLGSRIWFEHFAQVNFSSVAGFIELTYPVSQVSGSLSGPLNAVVTSGSTTPSSSSTILTNAVMFQTNMRIYRVDGSNFSTGVETFIRVSGTYIAA